MRTKVAQVKRPSATRKLAETVENNDRLMAVIDRQVRDYAELDCQLTQEKARLQSQMALWTSVTRRPEIRFMRWIGRFFGRS